MTDDWLPMSSAPKDGTIILLCELNYSTGEGLVMPGAYMNNVNCGADFWAVWPTSRQPVHLIDEQAAADAVGLPVGWRAIALTPVCWKPLPAPEPVAKLRRRQAQILSRKYKNVRPS